MPSQDRGFMIAEAVSAMNFEYHLKKLTERREHRKRGRKKIPSQSLCDSSPKGRAEKNSPSVGAERTKHKNNVINNYSGKGGVCQLPQSAKLTASCLPCVKGGGPIGDRQETTPQSAKLTAPGCSGSQLGGGIGTQREPLLKGELRR